MAPSTIRKAIGVVKDQTSISLAKVASNISPDLDVAIVKATSHEDEPADEKHVREILNLTSYSRGYVSACVATVSRRLGKTRDWIVALKTLMLVHRLLTEGDPVFHHELSHANRRGTRLLNMSGFRDEAHSSSWDHSAFVRTYALYLDQRLECGANDRKQSGDGEQQRSHPPHQYQYSDYSNPGPYGDDGHGRNSYAHHSASQSEESAPAATPLRHMKPERVLDRMHQLQQLLDRFLACRPTGLAKDSRMVLSALYPIIRDSFQLYADICEILAVLLDRYFDMDYAHCVKSFQAYGCAAKQIDELAGFYGWCKTTGVARPSEYPEVQRIGGKLLETLEEFMRDRAIALKTPLRPVHEEEPLREMNSIKALPAPSDQHEELPEPKPKPMPEPEPEPQPKPQSQPAVDLVDLREDTLTADARGNKLALALFSAGAAGEANATWEAFPSSEFSVGGEVASAWHTPAAEQGKADWELALVETASSLAKQTAAMGGGFDALLLDGMYDQAAARQRLSSPANSGSASSVALPGKTAVPVLALPAPNGAVQGAGGDPFAASLSIPPPSYVQMSDVEKKQLLLAQEQQLWHQYGNNGMQGPASLAGLGNGYYHPSPAIQYGVPQPAAYYYPNM